MKYQIYSDSSEIWKNYMLFFPCGFELTGGETPKTHNRMCNLRHTLPASHKMHKVSVLYKQQSVPLHYVMAVL